MQKILNDPEPFVDEMLEGILAAHPSQLRRPSPRAVVRADAPVEGKVGIATGGGSGHLPVFMGYVGRGVLDGAAIGNVFASPSSDDMLDVTRAISAALLRWESCRSRLKTFRCRTFDLSSLRSPATAAV